MYYTVIKHSVHLRTLEKCRKHSPAARVVYISLVFSNAGLVLLQCDTRLRVLYLLNLIIIVTFCNSQRHKQIFWAIINFRFCYNAAFLILLCHVVLVIFNCCQFSASVKLLDFSHMTRVLDSIGAEC